MTAGGEIKLLAENKNDMSIKKREVNLLSKNPLQSILEKLLRLFKDLKMNASVSVFKDFKTTGL